MIEFLNSLITILREEKVRESEIVEGTGINKTTIHDIFTGKNDNPHLQTVIAIADYANIRPVWETETSKRAVSNSDISAYREMMANRDRENDILLSIMKSQREALDRKDRIIEELTMELRNDKG